MPRLAAAAILWFGLWLPPLRNGFESDMALHMVVQIPLLAIVGILIGPAVRRFEPRWLAEADWLGIPGIVLVLFSTSYWMLPLALDSVIGDWRMEVAKFLSLPLLVGLPLALSWQRMPVLGRLFVIANVISKVGALGGLYLATPIRLCAYYRLDQQAEAGRALIAVAAGAIVAALLAAFFGWPWRRPDRGAWAGGPTIAAGDDAFRDLAALGGIELSAPATDAAPRQHGSVQQQRRVPAAPDPGTGVGSWSQDIPQRRIEAAPLP